MKISRNVIFLAALLLCVVLVICFSEVKDLNGKRQLTIRDIAYDVNKGSGYTVYIKENNVFTPYLVLTDDYNGKVLLLRKYLLPNEVVLKNIRSEGSGGSYYPVSELDAYLNMNFLLRFSKAMQNKILDTKIEVTTAESLQRGGSLYETESIKRKIFVLSATELNIKHDMANVEGKPLKYFGSEENLIALTENGDPNNYWLRTPYLCDDIQTWGVTASGMIGGGPVAGKRFVRPAFCVEGTMKIKENSHILQGQKVYVLE